ncbi:DnaJ domain protein [Polaromonas naphthalenivorans CJ2]|uniref:DnaJ domain protein n=2 Tax=Polaromonas naphthalenivorans TaxID=216465 RepID=A1VSR5_POLNA|nr:DnaJ domain protein [Polaromonas naphthalenivorans CJ2]
MVKPVDANAMKKPKAKSKPKSDLFAEAAPAADPVTPGSALRLDGGKGGPRLSAGQQRFNRLLAKIDKLEGQVTEIRALADAFRPLYQSTLEPLRGEHRALMRRMALCLDERLQRKGLSPAQKRDGLEILCDLCETLAAFGDEAMAALHDQRSERTLRQKEQEHAAMMRSMMENALGRPLDVEAQDDSLDPLEAVLRAGHEGLHEAMQADEVKREAAQARRKKKTPTPAQIKAGQEQEDADSVLRQVYRQLASALHPDRERDPAEHQRKTALMSEANAAYAKQDLMALLHLQLRIAQADAQDLLQQPEERIAAMSRLLKQQATELENELFARQHHLKDEFDLDIYQMPTAATLRRQLELQAKDLKEELAFMEADIAQVQDDAGFKRWLKAQRKMSREADYF